MTQTTSSPRARLALAALLAVAGLALGADYASFRNAGPIHALRGGDPVAADDTAGSVAPFCGFAPCGMPLLCEP
ncbi:hypothetical protein BER2_3662 [plant metagenome]|uniref:Uncharacterized protein n=1 Tax=plant metagenome TaxID=1297885 RepID=A0A484R3I2_9ZZZZ